MATTLSNVNVEQTHGVSSSTTQPLSSDELRKINAYWRACNYLAAGMIYLRDNPLLREPLKQEQAQIGTIYLRKAALNGTKPQFIEAVIKATEID